VASKTAQQEPEKAEVIEEALAALDDALDRLKVLYEQYFLGLLKQPPQFVHIEVERKLRDLAQLQIRNTALRYRFVTLQQKFGSYNTYWRRTLREIEAGRYIRSLSKITRQAAATGAEIPYEILAAMPRRMREQVRRDREAALAIQRRRRGLPDDAGDAAPDDAELLTLVPLEGEGAGGRGDAADDEADEAAEGFIRESTDVRQALRARGGTHVVDESDGELDLDAFFREVEAEEAAVAPGAALVPPLASAPAPSSPPSAAPIAPSQRARPNPIAPGSSSLVPPVRAEVMAGPFPRPAPTATPPRPLPPIAPSPLPPIAPSPRPLPPIPAGSSAPATPPPIAPSRPSPTVTPPPITPPRPSPTATPPRPAPTVAPSRPTAAGPPADGRPVAPPGMSQTDVNALYARYVKAKETIGQTPNPGSFNRLIKTLHAQAPKIMEQYQAKGVDFTVAIQDNQVVIRAKPKL